MLNEQPYSSFDISRAIATHVEQRNKLENYISGKSGELPDPKLTNCNADCLVAKWLHNQRCQGFNDIPLLNQICNSCEIFQSTAYQAVLLVNRGKNELAKEALQDGGIFFEESARLQQMLIQLHYQLNTMY